MRAALTEADALLKAVAAPHNTAANDLGYVSDYARLYMNKVIMLFVSLFQ